MGLGYQVETFGTTYTGNTAFLSSATSFVALEDFFLDGVLLVESAIGASNSTTTDPNNFDIGLFVGNSGSLPAGVLGFATNTFMHLYNGGNDSQRAGIDVVEQSFDPNANLWRFIIGDEATARSVQLNNYRTSSGLFSAEKPIIAGEITLRFSPDLRSIEGEIGLYAGGFIEPTTAYYGARFEGSLTETYPGFAEESPVENDLLQQIGFDAAAYLDSNDDLRSALGNNLEAARQHYLEYGLAEGRLVNFDAVAYIASYDDLINAFGYDPDTARQHYLQFGSKEGRSVSFEADDYVASYGDLIQAFGDNFTAASEHFIRVGAVEGRSRDRFNEANYLNKYSDLRAAFGSDFDAATRHYINHGFAEGRSDF